jgi:hypothetical protein
MKTNGINSTTWTPAWNHGKTQVIRVPIALTPKILEYARKLDSGKIENPVLQAIDEYVEWRRSRQHPNQYSTKLNMNARTWDELRKFRVMVEEGDMGTNFEVPD